MSGTLVTESSVTHTILVTHCSIRIA